MTLPKTVRFPGIVGHPCGESAEDRNWDALRRILNEVGDDIDDATGGPVLERIRLTAPLTALGSAAAVKLNFTGGVWAAGDAITVYDDLPSGPWQGGIGHEGWARQRETTDTTNYSLVYLERLAYYITGTLAGALSGGSATATVTSYSDGVSPGASVTVFDANSRFAFAITGAKFKAAYDFRNSRYEVITCEQPEWVATCTAAESFGPATASVAIGGFTPKSHSELNDTGAVPVLVENTFGLTGIVGDLLHIQKRSYDGIWEILVPDQKHGGASPRVVYFEATAQLLIGGSTTANILEHNGSTYVATTAIQVFDPYGYAGGRGMWSGASGFKGFAKQREDDPLFFDIIWMEQYARFIYFQLTADMSLSEATANVVYAFGQGITPGGSVTVHDDANKFKYALAGAWGFAVRNEYLATTTPTTPYYQVVICDQTALYGQAQLAENMCGATADVTQYEGWSTYPHGQTPALGSVTEAKNPYSLAGKTSEPVLLVFRDKTLGLGATKSHEYVVAQAVHKEVENLVDVDFNDGCWRRKKQKQWVMFCQDPSDFEEYICGEDCAEGA